MDWDNDGDKDLVLGVTYGYIRIYFNTGTDAAPVFDYGTTGYLRVQVAGVDFTVGSYANPEIVDWNNDGMKDLLCGEYNGWVYLLLNTGSDANPLFPASTLIQDGGADLDVGYWSHPIAVDWDLDGKKDLIVGNSDGYAKFFKNTGTDANPQFDGSTSLNAGGIVLDVGMYSRPELVDWDNDGVNDLLVGAYDGTLRQYHGVPKLMVTIPDSATEGDGLLAGQGRVGYAFPVNSDLVVTLDSADTSEVTVTPMVTILAGQSNVTFDLTVMNDPDLDGSQDVQITASTNGQPAASANIRIADNESAVLSVSLPVSATEGDGILVGQGRVFTGALPADDIEVTLTSDDTSELTVAGTVTVLAGQTSATFSITIVDDNQIDGPQTAGVTAHVDNWIDGADTTEVLDNENTNLVVTLPTWVGEGDGVLAGAGRVTISGTLEENLTVSLASDDTTELQVPVQATILAGNTWVGFNLTVMEDPDSDGMQTATVTASATGFADGARSLTVADNEIDHFTFSTVPSPQTASELFSVTITSYDVNGSNAAFAGTVDLTCSGDSGALALDPTVSGAFTQGEWTGNVRVNAVDTNVRLALDDGAGHTAESNPFDVTPGDLHHFAWDVVPSPQYQNLPTVVTLIAKDANDYTITDYPGPANLTAMGGTAGRVIGAGSSTWGYPLSTYYHDARTQVIFLQSEIGQATIIKTLTLEVTTVPGQVMDNWTIRMKHTSLAAYPGTPAWEGSGWTTVYQNNENITAIGPATFVFSTPFYYNGTDNLMIDFSFNNTSWTTDGICRATPKIGTRSLYYCTDSGFGDPLAWSGTGGSGSPTPNSTTLVPDVVLDCAAPVAMSPSASGVLTNGTWSGPVTALESGSNVCFAADDGAGNAGISNPFHVWSDTHDGDTDDIPDWWEALHGGTNRFSGTGDYDGDRMSDGDEFNAGTIPTNALSVFCIEDTGLPVPGKFVITWQSVLGKSYNIESCTDLPSGDWTILNGAPIPGDSDGFGCYTVTVERCTFFRVTIP